MRRLQRRHRSKRGRGRNDDDLVVIPRRELRGVVVPPSRGRRARRIDEGEAPRGVRDYRDNDDGSRRGSSGANTTV